MLKKNLTKVIATVGAMAAGVAAGTAAVHADSIYTVQSGDTLSGISMKFTNDISKVNELARMNNIQDINKIYVGQKLLIKSDGEIQQATAQQVATLPAAINANQSSNATSQNSQSSSQSSTTNNSSNSSSNSSDQNLSGSEAAAKAWIAQRESGGNYNAQNGQYVGKYQLSASYLNGDYSPANQERVANQYVAQRYGSWVNAQAHWEANGWY
ncbi:LysM peptidoglycan-binding domain-containing protein [Limosilactobacillus sp.]|uniref:aggregation-promoting factor n=1 Tax=Limosilactobacillus sp. TaxID=2773925 RepID=UPI00345EA2EB